MEESSVLFSSYQTIPRAFGVSLPIPVSKAIDYACALPKIGLLYNETRNQQPNTNFTERLLAKMDVSLEVTDNDRTRIPTKGAVVVTANHPFGLLDATALLSLLISIRPDVKIIANSFLSKVPELAAHCLFVDPFGGAKAALQNVKAMKEAIAWLRQGGMLAVFPAGEVAAWSVTRRKATEANWNKSIAKFIRNTDAQVLPVFIHGKNSKLFQFAGMIHPSLRTALLPREFLKKAGSVVSFAVGNPISNHKLLKFETDEEMTMHLRERTLVLQNRVGSAVKTNIPQTTSFDCWLEPIIDPIPVETLQFEINHLPKQNTLIEHGDFVVHFANAKQIPNLLKEIGRLREITFRSAGEGSGKALDIDPFDRDYIHLFVWHRIKQEIVGAYRLGLTDRILIDSGIEGLYTHTLFHYRNKLLNKLIPALELGRSFVRAEYQRNGSALSLLWRGIGAFVVKHPKYNTLFGPVSISNEYHVASHQLLVHYLLRNRYWPEMAKWVNSRNPFHVKPLQGVAKHSEGKILDNLDHVNAVVSDIEHDSKGAPVLLKEYLKLGGKLLGFNVDTEFSNVVDGLIVVDLLQTDRRILERYMGKAEAKTFLRYHGIVYGDFDGELNSGDAIPIYTAA